MTTVSRGRASWFTWVSLAAFLAGTACVTVYFLTIPDTGPASPWAPLLLIVAPYVLGAVGIVFAVLAKHWILAALNVLLVITFPAVMFLGTLILGP